MSKCEGRETTRTKSGAHVRISDTGGVAVTEGEVEGVTRGTITSLV